MQNFCGLFRILHILSERLHALNDIIQAITRFVNYIHERPEEVLQRLGCAG
ncbi:hypothetical protein [Parageobacillus galactosidasius]|uniref:hypothetical protein n=1 Tax=Parageobacillus galactosidasius TaxID=883812 RepID=UPI00146DA6EA|nr:hypothetical protein [Parageobacillus galactosidasius]